MKINAIAFLEAALSSERPILTLRILTLLLGSGAKTGIRVTIAAAAAQVLYYRSKKLLDAALRRHVHRDGTHDANATKAQMMCAQKGQVDDHSSQETLAKVGN